jgi:hypothetical protein
MTAAWLQPGVPSAALVGVAMALAGLALLFADVRRRRGIRPLAVAGALLALAAPAAALWWAPSPPATDAAAGPDPDVLFRPFPIRWAPPAETDRGRPVPLYAGVDADVDADYRREERALVGSARLAAQLIRLAPADGRCNCHGWIFAGGRYWMRPDAARLVLEDNGYVTVSVPRPGDLAVYFHAQGWPVHSAIVRAAPPDGPVLVESKWGWGGRYLHPADTYCEPAARFAYYRSSRNGHLIRGIETSPGG